MADRTPRTLEARINHFVENYMPGRATPKQKEAISRFLRSLNSPLWAAGRGGGKSTVRGAIVKYLIDEEKRERESWTSTHQ